MHARPRKALSEHTHKRRQLMEPNKTELAQRAETRTEQAHQPKLELSKPSTPQEPQRMDGSPAPETAAGPWCPSRTRFDVEVRVIDFFQLTGAKRKRIVAKSAFLTPAAPAKLTYNTNH